MSVKVITVGEKILGANKEKAKAAKITSINLIVGELAGVVPECVQFYFDAISKNTMADGAKLNFEIKPTQIKCRKCQNVFTPTDYKWECPKCHETSVEIASGRECYMESIEVE